MSRSPRLRALSGPNKRTRRRFLSAPLRLVADHRTPSPTVAVSCVTGRSGGDAVDRDWCVTHQQPLDVDYATDHYMKTYAANRAAPAALPVQSVPGFNEDFARWYYDDEPLPTSTKEVPF